VQKHLSSNVEGNTSIQQRRAMQNKQNKKKAQKSTSMRSSWCGESEKIMSLSSNPEMPFFIQHNTTQFFFCTEKANLAYTARASTHVHTRIQSNTQTHTHTYRHTRTHAPSTNQHSATKISSAYGHL
jgi:hypothetical protein